MVPRVPWCIRVAGFPLDELIMRVHFWRPKLLSVLVSVMISLSLGFISLIILSSFIFS